MTGGRVLEFNRMPPAESLPIGSRMVFKRRLHCVNFDGRLNFSLQNLTDPDAAIRALQQARKAAG